MSPPLTLTVSVIGPVGAASLFCSAFSPRAMSSLIPSLHTGGIRSMLEHKGGVTVIRSYSLIDVGSVVLHGDAIIS